MEALSILKNNATLNPLNQSILDKRVSLPPNELVTKQYAPDIKPVMKLMQICPQFRTKQQMQQNQKNINYLPPKIKNQQFVKYAQHFHPSDFLGYQYSQHFDQMVYFRYNNQDCNEFIDPNEEKAVRYFGGLFIPLTALQSKHFKTEDNIYNSLNLSVPEIKDTVTQSFSKNSKGCSFDPMFSSNFCCGNMMAVIRKNPFQYDIVLQNDTNCKASEWFNFAVKFIEQGTYKFNIVNLSNSNPLYDYGMKIPYYSFFQQSMKTQNLQTVKSGEGWSFGGMNVTFSKTQTRKEKRKFDETYYCLSFEYKVKNKQDIVIFASAIPYTSIDYDRFLNRALYNKIGQHMRMQTIEVCQTLAGTTLSAYLFYHRKSKSNTVLLKSISQEKLFQNERSSSKRKTINLTNSNGSSSTLNLSVTQNTSTIKTIVILARQHPGETSASFILEGIIQFLMDNTQFDVFKKNFQFIIIPFVNPDGVKYGNQRVNLAGSDLNKSWKNPNQIFEPQVYHIKKLLKSINQLHPISLLINLSSTNQNFSSYFKSNSSKKYCEQIPQLFPYLMSKRVPQVSFQTSEFQNLQKSSLASTLSDIFPKSLVYDFTSSLYGWRSYASGLKKQGQSIEDSVKQIVINQITPEIYRMMGKQLISAYLEYVRLCSRNIGIQERWLKQIEDLSLKNSIQNKQQNNLNQQIYEQSWSKDLIRLDFSSFNPSKIDSQRAEGRKHKTMNLYHIGGNGLQQVRSKTKKLTVSFLKNNTSIKDEKENSLIEPQPMASSADQVDNIKNNSSMDSIFGHVKKSAISSSLFTPKRRSEILKQISESIKQSSIEKETSIMPQNNRSSGNLLAILQKKQQKLPGLIRKKSQLVFSDKIQIKDLEIRDKNKEGFMKFQSLKRSIPALGIKAQFKQLGRT